MSNEQERLLIKQAINRLHETGSSDWQSLYKDVEENYKVVNLNLPQMAATMSKAKTLVLEWGRGTGKTTILGMRLRKLLKTMPRSSGLLIAPTYLMTLTKILPSLIQGLEMFGLFENLHYFIGREPPRSWRNSWGRAYQPPRDYGHYITFFNGMGAHLISQDVPGDGRALNTDWIIGMEAAMLNSEKLQENTDPTLRGTATKKFVGKELFGSKMYESSTPITPEGMWMLDYEEKAMMNPTGVNFISADCRDNAHNLRPGYLEEAQENSLYQWLFEAEYLNVRPSIVKDGFYSPLSADVHAYESFNYNHYTRIGQQQQDCRGDGDLVKGVPLIVACDWGATINCLTINQHLKAANEYRTIKSMFVLGDENKVQQDLFQMLNDYYQYHDCKDIYLWYDHSGNHRTGMTKYTRAQMVQRQLTALGWRVHLMTVGGSNPSHEQKHLVWKELLAELSQYLPKYRINKSNCKELWISMTNAQAVRTPAGQIVKSKRSEKSKKIPRQLATDLSDANDIPIFGLFFNTVRLGGAASVPPPRPVVSTSR